MNCRLATARSSSAKPVDLQIKSSGAGRSLTSCRSLPAIGTQCWIRTATLLTPTAERAEALSDLTGWETRTRPGQGAATRATAPPGGFAPPPRGSILVALPGRPLACLAVIGAKRPDHPAP